MLNLKNFKNNKNGFTFLELLVVIGLVTILASSTIPVYGNFQVASQLNESGAEIVQLLRQAREYSAARKENSSYGVFFEENSGTNDRVIFYKGNSYAARDGDYDLEINLGKAIEMDAVIIGDDINFSRAQGLPGNIGTVTLTTKSLASKIITINEIGMVDEN